MTYDEFKHAGFDVKAESARAYERIAELTGAAAPGSGAATRSAARHVVWGLT